MEQGNEMEEKKRREIIKHSLGRIKSLLEGADKWTVDVHSGVTESHEPGESLVKRNYNGTHTIKIEINGGKQDHIKR